MTLRRSPGGVRVGAPGKVTKERDEAAKVFEEFAMFCDDESVAKEHAITDSKEAIEEFTATVADSQAIIETEDAEVGDLGTKISDTESELPVPVRRHAEQGA